MMDALGMLAELVAIPSVTDTPGEAQAKLSQRLQKNGANRAQQPTAKNKKQTAELQRGESWATFQKPLRGAG